MRQLVPIVAALVLVSCSRGEQASAPPAPAPAATSAATDLSTRLVAADRADGVEDHVVSKCLTCAVAMDGSPALSASAEGYTFHLCSDACRDKFVADPKAAIAALDPAAVSR